jgi:hypothetical protein
MSTLLLSIDDTALPLRKNVCLHLSKPAVRKEPVLAASPFDSTAPDNLATHFYGTVLHDNGLFRMWYYACHWGVNPDWPPVMKQQIAKSPFWIKGDANPLFQGPICYAESTDGINWTKPSLGQLLFKGSTANNALALPHTVVSGALVVKDAADPDPARRYKMVYQFFPDQTEPPIEANGRLPSVAMAVSPDGLRWTVTAIPFRNQFVEPSSFLHHQGAYQLHYQVMEQGFGYGAEGGSRYGRTGVARVSPDFDRWPDLLAEAFAPTEPEDRARRGTKGHYDQIHLGVGAASFGNVCVGLFGLWHNADFKEFGKISCDFGLLVSNDGLHFREPVKGARFLRREDSPVTPVPGHDFNTILCQANGIVNVGGETRIYYGRWRNVGIGENDTLRHYTAEVALATLPRDRWAAFAVNPSEKEKAGAVCTAPVLLAASGAGIFVNAEGAEGMVVSLLDEAFGPIAGFEEGRAAGAGGLDCPVFWKGRDLRELGGRSVRIHIRMSLAAGVDPRLYAVQIR